MRRLLAVLILACVPAFPAFVQQSVGSVTLSAQTTANLTIASVGYGNTLFVGITQNSTLSTASNRFVTSLTGTNITCTLRDSNSTGSDGHFVIVAFSCVAAGGNSGTTLVAHIAVASTGGIVFNASEFSLVGTYENLGDGQDLGADTTLLTNNVNQLVSATNNDILWAVGGYTNIGTSTIPTSGWTGLTKQSSASTMSVATAYNLVNTAGAQSPSWTLGTSGNWAGTVLAFKVGAAPPPFFTISPTTAFSGAQAVAYTLTGFSTTWGSNTFSIDTASFGSVGASKVSQNITSATAATVVVNLGHGAGLLGISDGGATATTTVTATAISVSPSTVSANGQAVTLTLTGTNTTWGGGTVFTLAGACATKVSQNVASATSATVVVNLGPCLGQLFVSDLGATANTYVVAANSMGATANTSNAPVAFSINGNAANYSLPRATIAKNLCLNVIATTTGGDYVLTAKLGGVSQTLTVTVPNGSVVGNYCDTTHSFTAAANTVITLTSTGTVTGLGTAYMEFQ